MKESLRSKISPERIELLSEWMLLGPEDYGLERPTKEMRIERLFDAFLKLFSISLEEEERNKMLNALLRCVLEEADSLNLLEGSSRPSKLLEKLPNLDAKKLRELNRLVQIASFLSARTKWMVDLEIRLALGDRTPGEETRDEMKELSGLNGSDYLQELKYLLEVKTKVPSIKDYALESVGKFQFYRKIQGRWLNLWALWAISWRLYMIVRADHPFDRDSLGKNEVSQKKLFETITVFLNDYVKLRCHMDPRITPKTVRNNILDRFRKPTKTERNFLSGILPPYLSSTFDIERVPTPR